ncbi:hypothetical protein CI238_02210 [Colletotrichum incanum]|uniref:Uncharacterized protein n=1 Tax=Colletotrichum incanum TaxID=1573173 RepID=A0A162PE20_COLIC|nr:hypothetical protein CI238_02210 [Colletotrichum incanum]OHW89468.1 hypothetical protein CSPAE12_11962 [Colletotrichum incanum]
MQLSTLTGASFLAVASAQNVSYPPINLGTLRFPHGNVFVAWSPFTPTKTQELIDVCDSRGAIKGTATWTAVRTYNTYVYDPICRNPFNITDDATNTTYYNLELACVDDNIPLTEIPQVTAVVDRATNKTIETCVPARGNDDLQLGPNCLKTPSESLYWDFACSP